MNTNEYCESEQSQSAWLLFLLNCRNISCIGYVFFGSTEVSGSNKYLVRKRVAVFAYCDIANIHMASWNNDFAPCKWNTSAFNGIFKAMQQG